MASTDFSRQVLLRVFESVYFPVRETSPGSGHRTFLVPLKMDTEIPLDFVGSITNLVGIEIIDIGSAAHIQEFEEEILVIGVAVALPVKGLDFVVDDALNPAR